MAAQQRRPTDPSVEVTARAEDFHSLTLLKAGVNFAKRHYLLTTLYIVGLLVVQFATGLAVSTTQRQQFDQALGKIDFAALERAKEAASVAEHEYRQSRGWFFTCDARCHELYDYSQKANVELLRQEEAYGNALSEARAQVGIFSEYGVTDARESFWDAYYRGAGFAKRMSYWDALWMSIGAMRRDESLLSVFLNWLLSAAINFTVGMVSALVSFMFHVGSLLFSYQASPISALSFFVLAFSGAFAVIASFIVGAYFAAATTAFVTLQATGNLRIDFEPAQGNRRMRIRQHHD